MYSASDDFGTGGMRTDMTVFGSAIIFIATTAVNIQVCSVNLKLILKLTHCAVILCRLFIGKD